MPALPAQPSPMPALPSLIVVFSEAQPRHARGSDHDTPDCGCAASGPSVDAADVLRHPGIAGLGLTNPRHPGGT